MLNVQDSSVGFAVDLWPSSPELEKKKTYWEERQRRTTTNKEEIWNFEMTEKLSYMYFHWIGQPFQCLHCFSLAEGHSWTVNYSRLPFHWRVTKKNVSLGTICGATGNIVYSHFGVYGAATIIQFLTDKTSYCSKKKGDYLKWACLHIIINTHPRYCFLLS